MRVVHVPYTYAPDPMGGTEVYVANLIRALSGYDVAGVIAAPGARTESYGVDGIDVARFRVSGDLTLDALYGSGDAAAAREFGAILDKSQPDLVHFHAFTSASSVLAVREARNRQLPVVFTYHTPAVTCQRGTLLQYGRAVCDGVMEIRRCTSCSLQAHGLPRALSTLLARVPADWGQRLQATKLSGGPWTALGMSALLHSKQAAVGAFLQAMDRIVAPSAWVEQVLVRNGVAAKKIVMCSQGISATAAEHDSPSSNEQDHAPLKIAFFGRLDPSKGVHILLAALRRIPAAEIRLDLYAVPPASAAPYGREMRRQAGRDSRVRLMTPVPSDAVIELMRRYDLIAVPSQCLETGPLVVLEAFAAGIPVIASEIGGIAERVGAGRNGLLVPYASVHAWAAALERLTTHRLLLAQLRAGIKPPPTMHHVGARMRSLYRELGQPH